MSKYPSAEELAGKVSWEGGAAEFVFGYGFKLEDLPEDLPKNILDAFSWLSKNLEAGDFLYEIDQWAEENS